MFDMLIFLLTSSFFFLNLQMMRNDVSLFKERLTQLHSYVRHSPKFTKCHIFSFFYEIVFVIISSFKSGTNLSHNKLKMKFTKPKNGNGQFISVAFYDGMRNSAKYKSAVCANY